MSMTAREENISVFSAWFASLAGAWNIEKTISDGSRFSGHGEFCVLEKARYRLTEEGKMSLASGHVLKAGRSWIWQLQNPQTLLISYPPEAGGSLYHKLQMHNHQTGFAAKADHLCGADIYSGCYHFSPDIIRIDQTIRGPAKHLDVLARYERFTP